ncbi:MAG: glutamine-hydrolyzing GMP synthase, partial [Piscinibacter sp.]|nr:glutamine-hydrolyzing GMP synthase [Piscinibacter sp.]
MHAHRVLILDFGSQYTQLIARRVRELGSYCEIHPWDVDDAFVRGFGARGVILSGGPESVTQPGAPAAPAAVFGLGVPVLGICYGMQTMAAQLGGRVEPGAVHEFGYAEVRAHGHSALLRDIEDRVNADGHGLLDVWMSHGDHVVELPAGFKAIASTADVPNAGMADEARRFYALQFHPEVTHTRQGTRIYERFLREICGCDASWNAGNIIEDAVARVRDQVGEGKVLLGLSGGVDSSVVAALLHKAIGDQLTCVFVDHGLLRHHEGDQVMAVFARNLGVRVIRVDAADRFFAALAGVSDPEAKRKIIGRLFIEVFDEEASKIEDVGFLAQGTIYPDVIESAGSKTGKAHVIKSHHNVGGLPETMKLKLVEPLRELFKDEVRRIGVELGLPAEMVQRHPFPGPGLGVRILGEVTRAAA